MTVTRTLPYAEWHRLAGTEADALWPHFKPEDVTVFVCEDEGVIVASWIAMRVWHAECLWIAPSHRGRFDVLRRLWKAMRAFMRQHTTVFLTGATSDNVRRLIHFAGGRQLPGELYALPSSAGRRVPGDTPEETLCQQQ